MTKKSKKQNKKNTTTRRIARAKKFESHYLAIALIVFLLLEGGLMTTTHTSDWQVGVTVLDVSSGVSQMVTDVRQVVQPVTDTIDAVNQFYSLAATEAATLLDVSDADPAADISLVTSGVYDFYQQASTQLALMLDISSANSWVGSVAGASITVR